MTRGRHISLRTKLASALLALGQIPYSDAKLMTDEQVCSLYCFDHYPIRFADGGPTIGWNLVPRLIAAHRRKTAKHDAPDMARERSVRRAVDRHVQAMLLKPERTEAPRKWRWPQGRKLRSRSFRRRQA